MNIEDALLVRNILHALTGSKGKTIGQVANECRTSARRASRHLLIMEKAGLVAFHADAKVSLADHLADVVYAHASELLQQDKTRLAWRRFHSAPPSAFKTTITTEAVQAIFKEIFDGRA